MRVAGWPLPTHDAFHDGTLQDFGRECVALAGQFHCSRPRRLRKYYTPNRPRGNRPFTTPKTPQPRGTRAPNRTFRPIGAPPGPCDVDHKTNRPRTPLAPAAEEQPRPRTQSAGHRIIQRTIPFPAGTDAIVLKLAPQDFHPRIPGHRHCGNPSTRAILLRAARPPLSSAAPWHRRQVTNTTPSAHQPNRPTQPRAQTGPRQTSTSPRPALQPGQLCNRASSATGPTLHPGQPTRGSRATREPESCNATHRPRPGTRQRDVTALAELQDTTPASSRDQPDPGTIQ